MTIRPQRPTDMRMPIVAVILMSWLIVALLVSQSHVARSVPVGAPQPTPAAGLP